MDAFTVPSEQRALLDRRTHSLKPLSTAGHLNVWQVVQQALLPIVIFVFSLSMLTCTGRFLHEHLVVVLTAVGVSLLLVYPAVAWLVLTLGIILTRLRARVRWAPVVYWTWWPFWRFVACCIALGVGVYIGDKLWYKQLQPFHQMQRLQAYSGVSSANIGGQRLSDAGLVVFDESAGVDRMSTGCLKNGVTYCVAPILKGGMLTSNMTADQDYDLFMVGQDCCHCPGGDFRCGEWNKPANALGGLRVLDPETVPFYTLATERWSSTYGRPVRRPIFFTWVSDTVEAWRDLWNQATNVRILAIVTAPFLCIAFFMVLNGILTFLHDKGLASPSEDADPPPSLRGPLSSYFLPGMTKHFRSRQEQQQSWANQVPSAHAYVL